MKHKICCKECWLEGLEEGELKGMKKGEFLLKQSLAKEIRKGCACYDQRYKKTLVCGGDEKWLCESCKATLKKLSLEEK